MPRPGGVGELPGSEVGCGLPHGPGQTAVDQRQVDVLPDARAQPVDVRGEDGLHGGGPRRDVVDSDADLRGTPVRLTGHAQEARDALGDDVVARPQPVGSGLPEAGD